MGKYVRLASAVVVAGLFFVSPLYAQFFSAGSETKTPQQTPQTPPAVGEEVAPAADDRQNMQNMQANPAAQNPSVTPFDYGNQEFVEEAKNQNNQGHVISFGPETDKKDQELIMLYMKDFNVYRSPSGQTRCSVQFAIVTTLPARLANISYRLQWPGMDTVLSFNNVMPETENHYNYSLLGDGCYSMDKTPNIVINRCRVKGMSQQACASKVRWITRRQ